MSPRPSKAAERRPELLAATVRVIGRRGVAGTRLADVAAEAGVSVGTVQHYFGTRARLLDDAFLFEARSGAWHRMPVGEAADGRARLVLLVSAALAEDGFADRWLRWVQFWAEHVGRGQDAGMSEAYATWRRPLEDALAEGVEDGSVVLRTPIGDAADRIVGLIDGLALQVLLGLPGVASARAITLVLDALDDLART